VSGDPYILEVLQGLNVFRVGEPLEGKFGIVGEGGKPELRNPFELAPSFLKVWNEFFELIELELEVDAEVVSLERLELCELLCVDWWFGA